MRQQGFRSDQIVEDHLIRSGSKKVEKPEPLDSNNSGIKPRWPVSQNIMRKHTEIYVFKLFPMRAESALWSDLLASLATTTASIVFRLGWKEKSCYCICIPLKHKLKSTKLFKFCSKFLNKTKKKTTGTHPCNCTSWTPHHVVTPVDWLVICSVHTCHQN